MKLLDASVLLHAYNADSPHHAACKAWVESVFNDTGGEILGLPWQTVVAFVRIVTHPGAVGSPITAQAATGIVSQWLARPHVRMVTQGDGFWKLFTEELAATQAAGGAVGEAAVAALAIEKGATLCSTDGELRRFSGLKLLNPLESPPG